MIIKMIILEINRSKPIDTPTFLGVDAPEKAQRYLNKYTKRRK
jgi:hypothetical protein